MLQLMRSVIYCASYNAVLLLDLETILSESFMSSGNHTRQVSLKFQGLPCRYSRLFIYFPHRLPCRRIAVVLLTKIFF